MFKTFRLIRNNCLFLFFSSKKLLKIWQIINLFIKYFRKSAKYHNRDIDWPLLIYYLKKNRIRIFLSIDYILYISKRDENFMFFFAEKKDKFVFL